MFALFKWMLWFCMPLTWMLIVFLIAPIFLWMKKSYRLAFISLFAFILFSILSSPAFSNFIGYSLEKEFPPQLLSTIPKADAILLLGGGVGMSQEGIPYPECYPAADRVVMAARLYHAGKAPFIIPSGESSRDAEKPLLEVMKVPSSAIICESKARDTAENAKHTLEILKRLGCKKALLVSSSWHLYRARMLYEGTDIEIIPVGCDYEATLARKENNRKPMWMKLPSAAALDASCRYLKEYLGILFYSIRKPSH